MKAQQDNEPKPLTRKQAIRRRKIAFESGFWLGKNNGLTERQKARIGKL